MTTSDSLGFHLAPNDPEPQFTIDSKRLANCFRVSRKDSQADASRKLGPTYDSVWPGLALSWDYLLSLWLESNLHAS